MVLAKSAKGAKEKRVQSHESKVKSRKWKVKNHKEECGRFLPSLFTLCLCAFCLCACYFVFAAMNDARTIAGPPMPFEEGMRQVRTPGPAE